MEEYPGFKKPFFLKSPTQRVFWVLMGFIELWVFFVFFCHGQMGCT